MSKSRAIEYSRVPNNRGGGLEVSPKTNNRGGGGGLEQLGGGGKKFTRLFYNFSHQRNTHMQNDNKKRGWLLNLKTIYYNECNSFSSMYVIKYTYSITR